MLVGLWLYCPALLAQPAEAPAAAPASEPAPPLVPASQPQQEKAVLKIQANLPETIRLYLPDPSEAADVFQSRAAGYADRELRNEFQQNADLALKYVREFTSPSQIRLSLQEAIRRALLHSYAIRVQAYNPAIEASRVVQAEARFDATVFFNYQDQMTDHPIAPQTTSGLQSLANQLSGSSGSSSTSSGISSSILSLLNPTPGGTETRSTLYQGGIRKLLASGAQVRTGFESTRTHSNLASSTLNPMYNDDVFFEITQPFLRGFGLDITKSEIQLRKLDQQMAQERYIRQVQQTIQQVEEAYWRLVAARRNLPVTAELVAQTERVLRYFEIRLPFDVQPVQVSNTQARLATPPGGADLRDQPDPRCRGPAQGLGQRPEHADPRAAGNRSDGHSGIGGGSAESPGGTQVRHGESP